MLKEIYILLSGCIFFYGNSLWNITCNENYNLRIATPFIFLICSYIYIVNYNLAVNSVFGDKRCR